MANSTLFPIHPSTPDHEVWQNLKGAIAASSGFKRWQAEKVSSDQVLEPQSLEEQVYRYLKETLETLAY